VNGRTQCPSHAEPARRWRAVGLLGFEPSLFEQLGDAVTRKTDQVDAAISAWRDVARDGD